MHSFCLGSFVQHYVTEMHLSGWVQAQFIPFLCCIGYYAIQHILNKCATICLSSPTFTLCFLIHPQPHFHYLSTLNSLVFMPLSPSQAVGFALHSLSSSLPCPDLNSSLCHTPYPYPSGPILFHCPLLGQCGWGLESPVYIFGNSLILYYWGVGRVVEEIMKRLMQK